MTKHIKSRKRVTVVVKEVYINIYFFILVGCEHLMLFFNHYWNRVRSFGIIVCFFSNMWVKLNTLYCIIIAT